jgi:SAM-dependent MidA family methyltransferase
MNELSQLIREEIGRSGPIRFERFMELALYHPIHGYYRREREKPRTGRSGDFFTSVSEGPLFGRLLARQFLEMWERLGRPNRDKFWLVEQGGEDGRLAVDILGWCREEAPDFFAAIRYLFIEEAPGLRRLQMKELEAARLGEKVEWAEALPEEKPAGVFFCNELVDAFPVRLVTRKGNEWRELHVGSTDDEKFTWVPQAIEDGELAEGVAALPSVEGYTTEINLRARRWIKAAAPLFHRGYFLVIDYGFPAPVYYAPFRTAGTLTAFRQHRRMADVLADPGEQDITAQVDFTALARAGESAGLVTFGFLDQHHFLMGIAQDEFAGAEGPRIGVADNLRAWQTLTHPNHLGARFQVLLQAKGAPGGLAGLRYGHGLE